MRMYLIRHSITYGNTLGRYIGTTDEPLCQEGVELLQKKNISGGGCRLCKPAEAVYGDGRDHLSGKPVHIIEDLAECDFGLFENKNYLELDGNAEYQRWIDSGEHCRFPAVKVRRSFAAAVSAVLNVLRLTASVRL